jgi:Uma2 family endonuclease
MSGRTGNVTFTYEDYLLFPDDGRRHELIGGEHFMTPAPDTKHQIISSNLHRLISHFVHQKRLGRLFSARSDVVLSDTDVVQPDLLFVSAARAHIISEKNIQGVPDLVVEIISETTRRTDEIVKRKVYEGNGVAEYWIVDPALETVKVYRMTDEGYVRAAELSREAGDTLTTPLLPEFRITLAEVFE